MSILVEVEWLRFPGQYHPEVNVFRGLQQRLRETGIVTATAFRNEGRPRTPITPTNEDSITAAVVQAAENLTLELSQPTVLEFASIRLLVDRRCVPKTHPLQVKFCSYIKKRNSLYIEKKCENCFLCLRCGERPQKA